MAGKSTSAKSGRLGTQFRGKLATAYGQRGTFDCGLWYVYSPRTNSDWVLKGDLEWDHFILAESDPRIQAINYAPSPIRVELDDGTVYQTTFDATVTYTDGSLEWREVKFADEFDSVEQVRNERQREAQEKAARNAGVTYMRWSENEIRSNMQRLANWRRIIPWLAAARGRSLVNQQIDLTAYFSHRHSATLGEIEAQWGEPAFPLYAAALFRGMQQGHYLSDLDAKPLSTLTHVKSVQEE